MIFAFLFGLSMDYEVFILSRMREEYDRTGSTETAVIQGIGRTGRLVTSAALILFLTFVAMASGPGTDLKMFATGLAAGILLDATVIRALIVPAVISLMGRWNWWLPTWPARLLRVEPSLPPRVARRDSAADNGAMRRPARQLESELDSTALETIDPRAIHGIYSGALARFATPQLRAYVRSCCTRERGNLLIYSDERTWRPTWPRSRTSVVSRAST